MTKVPQSTWSNLQKPKTILPLCCMSSMQISTEMIYLYLYHAELLNHCRRHLINQQSQEQWTWCLAVDAVFRLKSHCNLQGGSGGGGAGAAGGGGGGGGGARCQKLHCVASGVCNHFYRILPTHLICSFCKTAREKKARATKNCIAWTIFRIESCVCLETTFAVFCQLIGFVHFVKLRGKKAAEAGAAKNCIAWTISRFESFVCLETTFPAFWQLILDLFIW